MEPVTYTCGCRTLLWSLFFTMSIWSMATAGPYRSADQGLSWTPVAATLASVSAAPGSVRVAGVDAEGQGFLLQGGSWQKIPSPPQQTLRQLAVGERDFLVALSQDDRIWISSRAVVQWQLTQGRLRQVATGAGRTIWGVNAQGEMWGSQDAGSTWTKARPAPNGQRWVRAAVDGSGRLTALTADDSIWHSTDRGQRWTALPGRLRDLAVAADGSIWGVNSAGEVWHSANLGKNWIRRETSQRFTDLALGNASQLFAVAPDEAPTPSTGSIPLTTSTTVLDIQPVQLTEGTPPQQPLPVDIQNTTPIQVTGCVPVEGYDCTRSSSSVATNIKLARPCAPSNSTVMTTAGGLSLRNNECQTGRPANPDRYQLIRSTLAEFALVDRFVLESEQRFIQAVQKYPEAVLDFDNLQLRDYLTRSGGRLSYSHVEAHVFGDMLEAIGKPAQERTEQEAAVANWMYRGLLAMNERAWDHAVAEYRRWRNDPCAYQPPEPYRKDYAQRNKDEMRDVYANCSNVANTLANTFTSLVQVPQANPSVGEFSEWGSYLAVKDVVQPRQGSLNNTAVSMQSIAVMSSGAAAALAAGAGVFGASLGASVVATHGGLAIALPAVTAIFPYAGAATPAALSALPGAAGTSGAVVAGSGMSAMSAFAGPAAIVVVAVIGTTAAVTMTIQDREFHDSMAAQHLSYASGIPSQKQLLDDYLWRAREGKGQELLYVFSDLMRTDNHVRHLPVSVTLPPEKDYVYLTNRFLQSSGKVLTLDDNDKLHMAPRDPNDSNPRQHWHITEPDQNGDQRIFSRARGSNQSIDSDTKGPVMSGTGRFTGQAWRPQAMGGGWFRLANYYQGPERVLDTYNATGNYLFFEDRARNTSGTHWRTLPVPRTGSAEVTLQPAAGQLAHVR